VEIVFIAIVTGPFKSNNQDHGLLGCDMWSCRRLHIFQSSLVPPSIWSDVMYVVYNPEEYIGNYVATTAHFIILYIMSPQHKTAHNAACLLWWGNVTEHYGFGCG